ncbi:MAG: DUF58 domain-containing protein [Deltaproteobacteria bacterium]|nr:MAG: DUF58 domain-containing protein [Deltaproteobacteria bacterium]
METSELLKKIRHLEIKTKGLTRHIFSGQYHSAFKGRGMAFSEVRNYHFGDEVRTIDWNVTARFSEPYVKVFEEERELTVMLIIDVSGSSEFGTKQRTKKELALEISAILAFSAISNGDKVGAIFVSDKVERFIAPEKGRKHALYILRELIEQKTRGTQTDLQEGLKYFTNTQKKRSIAFLISDFIDDHDYIQSLKVARKKHDLIAIQLFDPGEVEFPDLGIIKIQDAETGEPFWIDSSDKKAKEQLKEMTIDRQNKIDKELKRFGIDSVRISTDEDIVKPMIKFFKNR